MPKDKDTGQEYIEYEGGRRVYLDEDDCPELDEEFFKNAVTGEAGLATLVGKEFAAMLCNKGGRPKAKAPKGNVSMRFDPDLLAEMRKHPGWQTDVNATMREKYLGK
ncbi:MAG: BrnA antitoxin family protein [Rickettsiales bacterium]